MVPEEVTFSTPPDGASRVCVVTLTLLVRPGSNPDIETLMPVVAKSAEAVSPVTVNVMDWLAVTLGG